MQAWITGQLTREGTPYTLSSVAKPYTPTTYRNAFVQRVRAARNLAEKTPLEMAQLLDVPKDTYHRYETRTLLPHHLLEIFCKLTGQDLTWLITGKHHRPEPAGDSVSARKLA
jgi:DNA-binding XRE family transcriptional regulator